MTDRDSNRTQAALAMFNLARHNQRVQVLELLGEMPLPVECWELAERVHARSGATTESPAELEQALHHVHLPGMDDVGILTYDGHERRITEYDTERLEILVEATEDVLGSLHSDD